MTIAESMRHLFGRRPRWPLDPSRAPVAVCEYDGWLGFMVEVLYPDAHRIAVTPGDRAARVLAAVPSTARAVLMNVNLSVTTDFIDSDAEWRAGLAARGLPALNIGATDVRKRTTHACCEALGIPSARAASDGPADERVIVKTTLNYGGKPEQMLRHRWGARAARFTTDISDGIHGPLDYQVCRRDQVPAAAWTDPSLVVERYIENPDGLYIRVYIVGPAAVVTLAWADGDIKKLSLPMRERRDFYFWMLPSETIPLGLPSDLATRALATTCRVAAALAMDFSGVDCVMDADGAIVPIDVNKTPYWGHPRRSPVLAHLRHGFNTLIGAFT